ncbi:hypothetical protein F4778DRAFT_749654 [Xylariomycetidae sp. FL2044]|nr:hypothetical protein F4778DRAFT_749654 [Xylariomycetidae sp. FL2044]
MVSPPAITVSHGFESLPVRPPTPPREKQVEADPKQLLSRQAQNSRLSLHTPPSHSPGSAASTNPTSRRTRKKVEFTIEANYQDAPAHVAKDNAPKQPTPISAPSSGPSKPIKSILKSTTSPNPPNPLDPSAGSDATRFVNLATMLESTIKQLAGTDRDSKVDAYTMLVRALKASNNLPDRIALQDKMSLFMQFIQRDVTLKGPNGAMDTSMVNHALTLLVTFLHFPAIASTLTHDFGIFIVDHCIRSFEDQSVPKDVVRHLMQVIAFQDFSPKVMTADRVGRLVTALHRIEEHLKGKSIIMSRILIYRRLIKQSRSHMVIHSDWLLDLFTDMLSSMKEMRAAAIALGLEASFTVGKEKQLSRRVMDILQLTVDDTKYIEFYVERLMAMAKDKADSAVVPQIWSVVILLLRCPVDRWEFFGPWLEIIQRCFNSGELHTKVEANYAWNRLVYALQLNDQSLSKTIGTVCQPFSSQLKRRVAGKQLEELRKVVVGSVCNLYYYAFKPNSTTAQIDSYWDACVRPLLQRLAFPETDKKQPSSTPSSTDHVTQATLILTGLLSASTPRIWKEDRVAENPLVRPDELPPLDAKWIRRNASRVFIMVEPILKRTFLDLSDAKSSSFKLWETLVGAVAIAASKEVKVSTDTAAFVGHAFSVLLRIWSEGLADQISDKPSQQRFLSASRSYLFTMINELGLLPFTEKMLSMNKQNSFIPVATPSHRTGKGQGLTRTPLHHLFSILSTLPPGISDDDSLTSLITAVFEPFLAMRTSRAKADVAQELMQMLGVDGLIPYGPWVFVSEAISSNLENSQASHASVNSGSEIPIGHEYRDVVKHLEKGIKSAPNLPKEKWVSLFHALTSRVREEVGEAGCAIAVVEPMSKTIMENGNGNGDAEVPLAIFHAGIELITYARQPRDRQALDAARRRLWGTSVAGGRSASFDPFDGLYQLANKLLKSSYLHMSQFNLDEIVIPLLSEVANFLARCSRLLVFRSLAQLQQGVGLWIQDPDGRFSSKGPTKVYEAVKSLWGRICSLFTDAGSLENFQLDAIEGLLCSAFGSKHKYIVSTVVHIWNVAFEHADGIQYPEQLKAVLISLHPHVDIVLPGLDLDSYQSGGQVPSFIDSQDDFVAEPRSTRSSQRNTPQQDRPSSSRHSATPGSVQLSLPKSRPKQTTPISSRSRLTRSSATPRLRHDNSQIQFAAVHSSSPSHALDSQVLTDRQKEVRERQQENAALFPEIRSSIENGKTVTEAPQPLEQEPSKPDANEEAEAATPEARQRFDDHVSSTPTPRRGQALMIEYDHEMTDDVPSSPPEPRRNLYENLKSRSRGSSVLDNYEIPSSPIVGSPAPKNQESTRGQNHIGQKDTEGRPQDTAGKSPSEVPESPSLSEFRSQSGVQQSPTTRAHDDPTETFTAGQPTTPSGNRQSRPQGEPRSDNDVYVDAPTSPPPQTPRVLRSNTNNAAMQCSAAQPQDHSFEMSAGAERSMARIVIELDSRRAGPLTNHDEISPTRRKKKAGPPTLECITVNTGEGEDDSSSPVTPSPDAEAGQSRSSSKSSGRRSRRKRKRDVEKDPESSSKKRRHQKYAPAGDVNPIPDSQPSPTQSDAQSEAIADQPEETDERMEDTGDRDPEASGDSPSPSCSSECEAEPGSPLSQGSPRSESDSEAISQQLILEASQQSGAWPIADEPGTNDALPDGEVVVSSPVRKEDEAMNDAGVMDVEVEVEAEAATARPIEDATADSKTSAMEKIMGSLREGLEGLRTATLSREEVYQIEGMFMDIKRELYEAEGRSRR